MELFHEVEGEYVILRSGGVFTQSALYRRGKHLYGKRGAGYVLLMRSGTSAPKVFWDDVSVKPQFDKIGRMVTP